MVGVADRKEMTAGDVVKRPAAVVTFREVPVPLGEDAGISPGRHGFSDKEVVLFLVVFVWNHLEKHRTQHTFDGGDVAAFKFEELGAAFFDLVGFVEFAHRAQIKRFASNGQRRQGQHEVAGLVNELARVVN